MHADPIVEEQAVTTAMTKSLMDLHPRELKGIIQEIPTLPMIYQELFQQMQDPEVSVPRIAEIISCDQALTAKILHLVNSAFYGYSKHINTISRAVVILGFQAVRSAALAISVFDYFKDVESNSHLDMTQYWRHSLAVACTCKVLAPVLNIQQAEESFVAGLLHDSGKLIEKRYFSEDFDEVCYAAQELHLSWFECEKALFQAHHAMIAKVLFHQWKFPSHITDAVNCHHMPITALKAPHLASLVHVADHLSYEMGLGAPGAWAPKQCSPDALKLLDFSLDDFDLHRSAIEEEIEQSMEILKLLD